MSDLSTQPDHFFDIRDGVYVPAPSAAGPWDPGSAHGSPIAALLAREIVRVVDDPAFSIGRITFDLFRAVPMRTLTVRAEIVRDGRRVKGVDAVVEHEGTVVSRATALAVRQSEAPATSDADFPDPTFPDPERLRPVVLGANQAPGVRTLKFAEVRPFRDAGPEFREGCWARMTVDFAPGEPLTPLLSVVALSDFTSAFSNRRGIGTARGFEAVAFINADISLHLHRYPSSEWVALAIAGRSHTAGVSVGHVALYDQEGALGRATTTSIAQRPPGHPQRPTPAAK